MDTDQKNTPISKKEGIQTPNQINDGPGNGNQKGIISILLILLILIVIIAAFVKLYSPFTKQPTTVKKTVMKQVVMTRSKDTGIVNRGLTGKAVDVNTGKIVTAARIFSTTDKTVYLELDFADAPKGTVIDYIRYKKGRYVDHGEIVIPKDNTKSALFNWSINNLLANVVEGQWRIATYTNGILAKRINYEIKNSAVSRVFSSDLISPTDPDYKLTDALARKK